MAYRILLFAYTLFLTFFLAAGLCLVASAKGFDGRKSLALIENKGQITDQDGHARIEVIVKCISIP